MPQDHMRGGVLGTDGLYLSKDDDGTSQILYGKEKCHVGNIYEGPRGTVEVMSEDGDVNYRFPKGTTDREVLMYIAGEQQGAERERFFQKERETLAARQNPVNNNEREAAPQERHTPKSLDLAYPFVSVEVGDRAKNAAENFSPVDPESLSRRIQVYSEEIDLTVFELGCGLRSRSEGKETPLSKDLDASRPGEYPPALRMADRLVYNERERGIRNSDDDHER